MAAVLEIGEKVHVAARRTFKEDLRRHFVGEVVAREGFVARLEGYVFVLNTSAEEYRRRPERRTRIIGLADANYVINILPRGTVIDQLRYEMIAGRLFIGDGQDFRLDVNEFGAQT